MKCYPCGFEGDFGVITPSSSDGYSSIIGRIPSKHIEGIQTPKYTHVGAVDIFVCPKCGALHSDMRGQIENEDRKS